MELWIRSQNKKILIKPKNIGIIEEGNWYDRESPLSSKYKLLYKITSENYFLGEYKSEERALEVLDEIQNKIAQNEILKSFAPSVKDIKGEEEKFGALFKDMIYEMPKE